MLAEEDADTYSRTDQVGTFETLDNGSLLRASRLFLSNGSFKIYQLDLNIDV
jgi:hypothetical protein